MADLTASIIQMEDKITAESVNDDKSAMAALHAALKDLRSVAEDCKMDIKYKVSRV